MQRLKLPPRDSGGLGSQNASWNQSRAPRAAPRCGIVVCTVPATSRLRRHPARNRRRNCVGPGLEVDPGPIADSDTEHSAAAGCQCPRVRARDCRCRALEPSTLALPPSWPMRGMRPAPASPDSPYPLQAPSAETATGTRNQGRSHVPWLAGAPLSPESAVVDVRRKWCRRENGRAEEKKEIAHSALSVSRDRLSLPIVARSRRLVRSTSACVAERGHQLPQRGIA